MRGPTSAREVTPSLCITRSVCRFTVCTLDPSAAAMADVRRPCPSILAMRNSVAVKPYSACSSRSVRDPRCVALEHDDSQRCARRVATSVQRVARRPCPHLAGWWRCVCATNGECHAPGQAQHGCVHSTVLLRLSELTARARASRSPSHALPGLFSRPAARRGSAVRSSDSRRRAR